MASASNPPVEHDAKTRGIILHIVEQIKSQGVFDRFRRDCLEELDSKEPYRQLKQRVESHVASFLSKQTFSANLPKNQLRNNLRANINQSEVLSKGVDRLLEQVLVEKSSSFYKEIENLVEEHLISIGHYTRYDKPQRADTQPKSELPKLTDKEIEDIIKQETDRLLEASADEKPKESDRRSMVDSPPPGTSGEVIEVETPVTATCAAETSLPGSSLNVEESELLPKKEELKSAISLQKVSEGISEEISAKDETRENQEVVESSTQNADEISETHANKGQEILGPEAKKSSIANTDETGKVPKPEISKEIEQANSSTDAGLQEGSEAAMDIDSGPSVSKRSTSEWREKIEDRTLETLATDQRDSTKGITKDVDVPMVSKLEESKADMKNATVKLAVQDSSTAGEEMSATKLVHRPEDVKAETSGEAKSPEVSKLEQTNPEVKESIVEKTRKPEVDEPVEAQREIEKTELAKSDASRVKTSKAQKAEEKSKAKTKKKQNKVSSKESTKAAGKKAVSTPTLFSTDEETDEDADISEAKVLEPNCFEELSDSDITVSSVHTSDLSSFEDSTSDMEYEDYKELVLKKSQEEKSNASTSKKSNESGTGVKIDSEEIDRKSKSRKEYVDETCRASKEFVTKEKKSGESGDRENIGIVEERGEKISDESTSTSRKKDSAFSVVAGNKSDESDANKNNKESEKVTRREKGKNLSDEPGEAFETQSKEKVTEDFDEASRIKSGATLGKKTDSTGIFSSETKRKDAHDSITTSSKSADPSETVGDRSPLHAKDENQPFSKEGETDKLGEGTMQVSEASSFKPIEPLQSLEPTLSRKSEPVDVHAGVSTSDGDETTVDDCDAGSTKLGKRRHSGRISTGQESESSNDTTTTPTDDQKEALGQRRSARVASKDRTSDKDEQRSEESGDSARKLRRSRSSQDKSQEVRASKSKEERRNEKTEKRTTRLASDSTDSDIKPSKRSKRTVKPTRCYSPSENS